MCIVINGKPCCVPFKSEESNKTWEQQTPRVMSEEESVDQGTNQGLSIF